MRCAESRASVCSSSGGVTSAAVAVCAVEAEVEVFGAVDGGAEGPALGIDEDSGNVLVPALEGVDGSCCVEVCI